MSSQVSRVVGSESLRQTIRAAGLKVTEPRLAVLQVLQASPHSSAESIFGGVQKLFAGSSLQAVYGILAAFTEAGLVRRFDPPGSAALFESRVDDNHHHLVCVRCGAVADVECVVGDAPCLTPGDTGGFAVFTAEVTFSGICENCQRAAVTPAIAAG